MASAPSTLRPILVYALPGSQFVFKLLSALGSRKIDHYVAFCPIDAKQRAKFMNAPDGRSSVPVMKVGSGKDAEIVVDSEGILKWLDEHRQTNFFPTEETSTISERASDGTLAAMVWYYNWVNFDGYAKSTRIAISRELPFSALIPYFIVDGVLASTRKKFRGNVKKVITDVDDDIMDNDEPKMRAKLVEELEFFQGLLKSEDQEYLIAGTTEPTAADFSVFAQVERLVGEGTASDWDMPPTCQELKDVEQKEKLARLWKWHNLMRERFPAQFKGKRPPKELLNTE